MWLAKTIAIIVVCPFLALASFEAAFPAGWCGTCPMRSFTVPGTGGKLRIVEGWQHLGQPTRLYFGGDRMDLPISPSFALLALVTLAATLAGLAPIHRPILKLLGFSVLAFVFTLFAGHFAADIGGLVGGLLWPPLPDRYLVWRAWPLPVLFSLTTAAAIISWLASFRLCKKFVNDGFVT